MPQAEGAARHGHPLRSPAGDADILIGASALTHGFGVVTNNEAHFRRIEGLQVDNWMRP